MNRRAGGSPPAPRSVVSIRKTPGLDAANRAVAVAYARGPVSLRSLGAVARRRLARRNAFAKDHTLHNAEQALEKIAARLEPLDFDVGFAIPTAEEIGSANRQRRRRSRTDPMPARRTDPPLFARGR